MLIEVVLFVMCTRELSYTLEWFWTHFFSQSSYPDPDNNGERKEVVVKLCAWIVAATP